ncbi:MAG TPA: DUF1579 domain-containing protein [Planctomycetota bacterium]|nr:DUF1579 domain-containing protein [Planctomycetota bacterium]
MRRILLLSGALCALFPLAASSPQEKGKAVPASMDDMMAAWKKAGAVNENHRLLEPLAGEWTETTKMYMDPSAPPMESTGTYSGRMIFGGRFLAMEHRGKMMEEPMEGRMTLGYDNLKKRYVSTWIDSMSTGIYVSEGTYDAGTKTLTLTGEMDDPMTGGKTKYRGVWRVGEKDRTYFEWYDTREGKETKSWETVYTRKK